MTKEKKSTKATRVTQIEEIGSVRPQELVYKQGAERMPNVYAPPVIAPNPLVGMISFIERCALNPEISVDKMNQLFDIQERMLNKQAEIEYNIAFAEMQAELPPVPARKKGQSGKHFTKGDANILVNPVLKKYGFALNFITTQEGNFIKTRATLRHRAGHSESTELVLPADTGGNKNKVQEIGSSQSYGERYTMKAILNLTIIEDETEDDGGQPLDKKKESKDFQNRVNADSKKASSDEFAWDKKTILLLDNEKHVASFTSSKHAGETLLELLGKYAKKEHRSEVIAYNIPIIKALVKSNNSALIDALHKFADEGK